MNSRKNIAGLRSGRLVATDQWRARPEYSEKHGHQSRILWLCKCDCGNEKWVRTDALTSNKTKSCGCYHAEGGARKNMLPRGEAAKRRAYHTYQRNAADRGIEFHLTIDEWTTIVIQPCAFCGALPSNRHKSQHSTGDFEYSGIDRIDSDKGYFVENCIPACFDCNFAKRDRTLDTFLEWVANISQRLVS